MTALRISARASLCSKQGWRYVLQVFFKPLKPEGRRSSGLVVVVELQATTATKDFFDFFVLALSLKSTLTVEQQKHKCFR